MKKIRVKIIVVVVMLLFCSSAYADDNTAKILLDKVKDFYMWALVNHDKVSALGPRIRVLSIIF